MTITSANAIIMFAVVDLFATPFQLQQFSADNIFTTEEQQLTEAMMGVDGYQAIGHVNNPVVQSFTFMADSPSLEYFEQWAALQRQNQEAYPANATVQLPSVGKKYTCVNGALMIGKPMPDAAKVLQPRRYQVSWESTQPSNI